MQENIFNPSETTRTAYIGQEKNACHAYEYNRTRGDSEESSGDRTEGPIICMNLITAKKLSSEQDPTEVFTPLQEILLNGKKQDLLH